MLSRYVALVSSCLMLSSVAVAQSAPFRTLEGVTFADQPGYVFVPAREFGQAMGWHVDWDTDTRTVSLNDKALQPEELRPLFDDSNLIAVQAAKRHNVRVWRPEAKDRVFIKSPYGDLEVTIPAKYVEVDLVSQTLRAWQGSRLVMETNVSTGTRGHRTPTGSWTAGPEKSVYKESSLYESSPMPFSVQVVGNYFIHGSSSVPDYPASHGCVRMPLTGRNAAKYFFNWVDLGTPVRFSSGWSKKAQELSSTVGS